jgi:Cytochrome C oxidase, cbb3-type, subunit III
MKFVWTFIIVIFILAAGAVLYAWSGLYNFSALKPHWAVTSLLIEIVRDRSIQRNTEPVQISSVADPDIRSEALSHFHDMCRLCHGAPGFGPEEFAKGLCPSPPGLTSGHVQEEWSADEIYWIVKNGLKMTRKPAFGPTHEEDLHHLVALLKEIPQIGPQQYRKEIERFTKEEKGHGRTTEERKR